MLNSVIYFLLLMLLLIKRNKKLSKLDSYETVGTQLAIDLY